MCTKGLFIWRFFQPPYRDVSVSEMNFRRVYMEISLAEIKFEIRNSKHVRNTFVRNTWLQKPIKIIQKHSKLTWQGISGSVGETILFTWGKKRLVSVRGPARLRRRFSYKRNWSFIWRYALWRDLANRDVSLRGLEKSPYKQPLRFFKKNDQETTTNEQEIVRNYNETTLYKKPLYKKLDHTLQNLPKNTLIDWGRGGGIKISWVENQI